MVVVYLRSHWCFFVSSSFVVIESWSSGGSAVPAAGVLFHFLAIEEDYRGSFHGGLRDFDRVLAPVSTELPGESWGLGLEHRGHFDPLRGGHGAGRRRDPAPRAAVHL